MSLPNLFVKFLGAIAFAMALCACSTVQIPELDSSVNYQRDLKFDIEYYKPAKKNWSRKHHFQGVGVLRQAEKYRVTVYAIGKVDMITLSSCHREKKRANPDASWWTKGVTFEFVPVKEHESDKACKLDLGVYEKKKGRHGWAMAVIDSDRDNLPAKLKCNGDIIKAANGTSFCQAKKGLIQSIHFKQDVEVAYTVGCEIKKPPGGYGMDWTYLMPPGRCTLFFVDRNNPDEIHHSAHFGYDTIPIRGVR